MGLVDGSVKEVQATALGWNYLHQGGRLDSTTDLYNFRNRDYNPETQRWMQQDPLGYIDGGNRYQYVGSNPVNYVDSLGLAASSLTSNPENAALAANIFKDAGMTAARTAPTVASKLSFWAQVGAGLNRLNDTLGQIGQRPKPLPPLGRATEVPFSKPEAQAPEAQPGPVPAPALPDTPVPGEPAAPSGSYAEGQDPNADPAPDQPATPEDKPQEPKEKAAEPTPNNSKVTKSPSEAQNMANDWKQGQATRPIIDRSTGKVIGEITADGNRVIRYPHSDRGTPEPHWNLEDKTTGENIHVVVK